MKGIGVADLTTEMATSTKGLLPVELTIHDHYGREARCALHKLPAIIGRDESADVQLTDPWTSHRHCEIDQSGNVLVVRDLHSKNGIFMHGRRVRESNILSEERFTVARTEIIVRYPGAAQVAIDAADDSKPPEQKPPQTPLPDTWELL